MITNEIIIHKEEINKILEFLNSTYWKYEEKPHGKTLSLPHKYDLELMSDQSPLKEKTLYIKQPLGSCISYQVIPYYNTDELIEDEIDLQYTNLTVPDPVTLDWLKDNKETILKMTARQGYTKKKLKISPALEHCLDDFDHKKTILLLSWIRRIHPLFKDGQLKITEIAIDKNDFFDSLPFPQDGLISLDIKLDGLDETHLIKLLNRLDNTPIYRLRLSGTPNIEETTILFFLQSLQHVDHFDLAYDNANQTHADKLTYRNHFFHYLGIGSDINHWESALKQWMMLKPWRRDFPIDGMPFLLPYLHNMALKEYLKKLYKDNTLKTHDYSEDHDSFSRNYEVYAGINACIAGMDDLFFQHFLDKINAVFENNTNPYKYLLINLPLTTQTLALLLQHLKKEDVDLPFTKLSLYVDKDLIKTEEFKALLEELNNTGLDCLNLVFYYQELKNHVSEITEKLDELADNVAYFVQIEEYISGFTTYKYDGCHLYLRSELPDSLAEYKNSYIFLRKNYTQALYYIKHDGTYDKVKINDFDVFQDKIHALRFGDKDKVEFHLKEDEIKKIITANGGYTQWDNFKSIKTKTISNVQKRHYHRLVSQEEKQTITQSPSSFSDQKQQDNHFLSKKIKLKELITNPSQDGSKFDSYIQVDLQHVEQAEQEQQIEDNVAEEAQIILDEQITEQTQHHHGAYHGRLVNRFLFGRQPYNHLGFYSDLYPEKVVEEQGLGALLPTNAKSNYSLVEKELFGNLPHAIKFCTHNAAMELSKNLATFAALNADNLPANFFIRIEKGVKVLDYDPYVLASKSNLLTPIPSSSSKEYKIAIFDNITLDKKTVKKWINNNLLFERICMNINQTKFEPKQLTNLWLKFGDEGCKLFFNTLNSLNAKHPDLSMFLYNHYLMYFFEFDHLLEGGRFIQALEKIKSYDDVKLECLKKFLVNTGASKHELHHTLDAFEYFWSKIETHFKEKNIPLKQINGNWSTPHGGSPAVYMERLLTILENAADLSEQVQCLDGLILDNYGAYYASKYEHFKLVSKEMQLLYDKDTFDKTEWQDSVYRVKLSQLHDAIGQKDEKEFLSMAYRFLGQEERPITISIFKEALRKLRQRSNLPRTVYLSLLFTSHANNITTEKMHRLLEATATLEQNPELTDIALDSLTELVELGIKMDAGIGIVIFEKLAQMNLEKMSQEQKKVLTRQFFEQFKKNKHGMLKCLRHLSQDFDETWSFIYAADTASYLQEDISIQAFYKDDLILFSALINSDLTQAYFKDNNQRNIKNNIDAIKRFLLKAIQSPKPNNLDFAFWCLTSANQPFSKEQVIQVFEEAEKLHSYNPKAIEALIKNTYKIKFNLTTTLPIIKDDEKFRDALLQALFILSNIAEGKSLQESLSQDLNNPDELQEFITEHETIDMEVFMKRLNDAWNDASAKIGNKASIILQPLRQAIIEVALANINNDVISKHLLRQLGLLKDIQNCQTMRELLAIKEKVSALTDIFEKIVAKIPDEDKKKGFITLLQGMDCSAFESHDLLAILSWLGELPFNDILLLMPALIDTKTNSDILTIAKTLHDNRFPTNYIAKIVALAKQHLDNEFELVVNDIKHAFLKNENDGILKFIFTSPDLSWSQIKTIFQKTKDTVDFDFDKEAAVNLLQFLQKNSSHFNGFLNEVDPKNLYILSKCYAKSINDLKASDIVELYSKLKSLSSNNVALLVKTCQYSAPNVLALKNALSNFKQDSDFNVILEKLEKEPFGKRDLNDQFNVLEVERVINDSNDLNNNTPYTYHYRKQLTEAFLFVNQIGLDLPLFNNKAAKDLSNEEIKNLFQNLKHNPPRHLDAFQKRILALALMREAMYRATGKFLYSTQTIALIDCLMHKGDMISGIDTGQGKSFIDAIKAALLWLDSSRVDLITSSLVDARRDINLCAPFMALLDIPFSKKAITSKTPVEQFQMEGINYSTASQLFLFKSSAILNGMDLDAQTESLSLVINESDDAILDDRTIYRYAYTDNNGIRFGEEWIYTAINDFVKTSQFCSNNSSLEHDLHNLRQFLKAAAISRGKPANMINRFSNEQLLNWIESAILVNYKLRENVDYVIPEEMEYRMINGLMRKTKVIKILMHNDKVSQDTTYGNGIQQLLYASLNQKFGNDDFIIEPETKTVISGNNKNLIDQYRIKKGFIWGSSATPGSTTGPEAEIKEQTEKYGLEFSKIEPHQRLQVKPKEPLILPDETAQFKALTQRLKAETCSSLVFIKDIETAQKFEDYLKNHWPKAQGRVQTYLGLGDEEAIIEKAGMPGQITITTSALGRNTDIPYDRQKGMAIYQTYHDTPRGDSQKSGRTGRQGSPGFVHYLFNAQDDRQTTVQTLQKQALQERLFNEELYNLLGHLFNEVVSIPEDQFNSPYTNNKALFLEQVWAEFSRETEHAYRQKRLNQFYRRDNFIHQTIDNFTNILRPHITAEQFSKWNPNLPEFATEPKERYQSSPKKIKLEDCISPEIMAFHFLEEQESVGVINSAEFKGEVREKLVDLFSSLQKHNKLSKESQRNYLTYIAANPAALSLIKKVHKEFLEAFLKEKNEKSQKSSFISRWLGRANYLSKVSDDRNYLLLFKAFTDLEGDEIVDLELLKQSIINLLNEYLQNGWFISKARKAEVQRLISEIKAINNVDDLITTLAHSSTRALDSDIESNKHRFLKPVNQSGNSRFQDTIGNALKLTKALTNKNDHQPVVEHLQTKLGEVVKDSRTLKEKDLTFDAFTSMTDSLNPIDKANYKVIKKRLKQSLASDLDYSKIEGMTGRPCFFKLMDKQQHEEKGKEKEKEKEKEKKITKK